MAVAVHLNRPPHSVRLHAWGRTKTGWWGCVTWQQWVRTSTGDTEIDVAAWVPAATLTRPAWSPPEELPRVKLADDSRVWPAPPGWPSWYAGIWLDGDLPCPPGTEPLSGPAWRHRK